MNYDDVIMVMTVVLHDTEICLHFTVKEKSPVDDRFTLATAFV